MIRQGCAIREIFSENNEKLGKAGEDMKIAVCMKQVPAYSEGNMDEKTGLIVRSGLEAVVNRCDLSALETALQIKEELGGVIDVFTMGPERAEAVIKEAYAMGADQGYCISHKAFGGADVLATSYTLMQAISSVGEYDLILCGRQTTDGDTSQVSGALAKWMNIPHFASVTGLKKVTKQEITFEQSFENEIWVQTMTYPCLLAVDGCIFKPRLPSLQLKMASRKKKVVRIGLEQLKDRESQHYGLKGSATRVCQIFPPQKTSQRDIAFMNGENAADYIMKVMAQIINLGEEKDE